MECHIPGPWRDSSLFSGFFRKAWSPYKKASLKSSWRTDFPKRTDWLWFCETEMFTEDTWERILRRFQLCVWFISWNFQVNHSSAPGWSFFCVCARAHMHADFFFLSYYYLVEHLLLMGLIQLNAGPEEAQVSLLIWIRKGGRGNPFA